MSLAGAGEANDPNCVVATGILEFLVGSMMDGPVDLPPSVVVSVTNIADLGGVAMGLKHRSRVIVLPILEQP